MKKLDEMTCHQALRIVHVLFLCGLAVLLAAGMLASVRTVTKALDVVLALGGVVLLAASIVLAVWKVRCPHCGASLLPGGRLPLSLPPHCPGCGKKL